MPKFSPARRIGSRGKIPTPSQRGKYLPRGRISQQMGFKRSVHYNRAVARMTQAKRKILMQRLQNIIDGVTSGRITNMSQIPQQYRPFLPQIKAYFEAKAAYARRVAKQRAKLKELREARRRQEAAKAAAKAAATRARNRKTKRKTYSVSKRSLSQNRSSSTGTQQSRNRAFIKLVTVRSVKLPWER